MEKYSFSWTHFVNDSIVCFLHILNFHFFVCQQYNETPLVAIHIQLEIFIFMFVDIAMTTQYLVISVKIEIHHSYHLQDICKLHHLQLKIKKLALLTFDLKHSKASSHLSFTAIPVHTILVAMRCTSISFRSRPNRTFFLFFGKKVLVWG